MTEHQFVQNPAISISRGMPLALESGIGALTLSEFIRDRAERFAAREALVQRRADGSMERWSYRELWERSVELAKSLIACGLGKGERVGVLMTNRAEFLSSVFGTVLAGGVATPLSTFSTPNELEYLLASSACSFLLLERQVSKKDFVSILCAIEPSIATVSPNALTSAKFPFLRRLATVDDTGLACAIENWQRFLAHGAGVPEALVHARAATVMPAELAVLFYSSGSTGKPKGILSAHRGVAIQLWRMRRMLGLADGVRSWTANGFFWSGNFAMVLGTTLAAGGSLILQRTFQPEEALDLIAAERASFLFAWPHQWAQLEAAANWNDVDLSSLVYIDDDTAVARHPTVRSNWIEPRHCYGNTETFTLSTGFPANTSRSDAGGSHGVPLPGNSIKIVDPRTGAAMPIGQRGEITVKGATLMMGYLGIPLDETVDDEGYFPTGDGGFLDAAGRLFWEGRITDIIKTGGANVSPIEVDEVVRDCPGVKLAQTVGVPHDTLGELVVTSIVRHDGKTLDEEAVRSFLKTRLASYKVPRRVLFFSEDELRVTGSAKIKTCDLRDLVCRTLAQAAKEGIGNQ
jgi:acyl-CoA synthetase (AMP-forming)/AMP-acid ligase II